MIKRESLSPDCITLLKRVKSEPTQQSDPWDSFVPKICVQNLVSTCILDNAPLNLRDVCTSLKGCAGYNPKRFAAVVQRFRNPKIAVLIFSTGKIVCTGAKTIAQAQCIIHTVVDDLKKMKYKYATIKQIKIENMVCSARLPTMIDRSALALKRPSECNYDVEQFPGVIMRHRPIEPITVLVFQSGKIVLTGARSETNALHAFEKVVPILRNFAIYPDKHEIQPRRNDAFQRPISTINIMASRIEQITKRVSEDRKKVTGEERIHEKEKIEKPCESVDMPTPFQLLNIKCVPNCGVCISCEKECAKIMLNDENDLFGSFCCVCEKNDIALQCVVCDKRDLL